MTNGQCCFLMGLIFNSRKGHTVIITIVLFFFTVSTDPTPVLVESPCDYSVQDHLKNIKYQMILQETCLWSP